MRISIQFVTRKKKSPKDLTGFSLRYLLLMENPLLRLNKMEVSQLVFDLQTFTRSKNCESDKIMKKQYLNDLLSPYR